MRRLFLTLGNVRRELALELGPPARVATATSMLRSIRPTAAWSTSALVALLSCEAFLALASQRPAIDGDNDHDDHQHEHSP